MCNGDSAAGRLVGVARQKRAVGADAYEMGLLSHDNRSLLDVLIKNDVSLPVHCGGLGAYGNCRIILELTFVTLKTSKILIFEKIF